MYDAETGPSSSKRTPWVSAKKRPRKPRTHGTPPAKTILEKLDEVLGGNWARAESEGFQPERLDGVDFLRAVHRYCDPRDATRARVLRACQKIDKEDVLISAPGVADEIRKEN